MTKREAYLPPAAAAASRRIRADLLGILGDDLVALWAHGGATFADRSLKPGDLDLCAVVAEVADAERDPDLWRTDPASRPHRIHAAQAAITAESGIALDAIYMLASEVGRSEPPTYAFQATRRHTIWAIYRAHWRARQYVGLHGARPDELVMAPTQAEVERALDRELEHLERHVYDGDAADPYEATYALFNGCRILQTLETGDAAISKRSAGAWGLEHLPARWHAAIRAAGRSYDGAATPEDNEIMRVTMPEFVAMVRQRLPITEPRPLGPPRWS